MLEQLFDVGGTPVATLPKDVQQLPGEFLSASTDLVTHVGEIPRGVLVGKSRPASMR
jgi:hypothetical protein